MKELINGKCFDWSDVSFKATGLESVQVTEISYDDEREADMIYGRGGSPRGYGTGNKKNSFKLSMSREDFNEIARVAKKKGKAFYSYIIEKIVVSYANEDQDTVTDVLNGCVFTKRSFKAASGDKEMKVDLEGFCYKGIKISGVEA